jgi:hypothetical protein
LRFSDRPGVDEMTRPGFGFLVDLAEVNGWSVSLARLLMSDGETLGFALRVYSEPRLQGRVIHGVRFPEGLPIDRAADRVFASLTEAGLV